MLTGTPGIDVSGWQPKINWKQVAEAGYRFVFIKSSEGLTYKSPTLDAQWKGAGDVGMARGLYHFFHPLSDPKKQAELVISMNEKLGVGELPIALDLEGYEGIKGFKGNALVDPTITFLETIEQSKTVVPILYTGPNFWKYRLRMADRSDVLTTYPLWEASYGIDPLAMPWPTTKWGTHWTFWQWTGSGRILGIDGKCDLNAFAGSEPELLALLTGGSLLS